MTEAVSSVEPPSIMMYSMLGWFWLRTLSMVARMVRSFGRLDVYVLATEEHT